MEGLAAANGLHGYTGLEFGTVGSVLVNSFGEGFAYAGNSVLGRCAVP